MLLKSLRPELLLAFLQPKQVIKIFCAAPMTGASVLGEQLGDASETNFFCHCCVHIQAAGSTSRLADVLNK